MLVGVYLKSSCPFSPSFGIFWTNDRLYWKEIKQLEVIFNNTIYRLDRMYCFFVVKKKKKKSTYQK